MFLFFDCGDYAVSSRVYTYESKIDISYDAKKNSSVNHSNI